MTPKIEPQRVRIRGRMWTLLSMPLKLVYGTCEHPSTRAKQIQIHEGLTGQKMLEILLHEIDHACNWDHDESVIVQSNRDRAKILWDLGYRAPWDEE